MPHSQLTLATAPPPTPRGHLTLNISPAEDGVIFTVHGHTWLVKGLLDQLGMGGSQGPNGYIRKSEVIKASDESYIQSFADALAHIHYNIKCDAELPPALRNMALAVLKP